MPGPAAHEKRTLVFDKVPENYMRIESSLFDVSPIFYDQLSILLGQTRDT